MHNRATSQTEREEALKRYAASRIIPLQNAILHELPSAKRTMAELRRAAGQAPGTLPTIWSLEMADMPECLIGQTDKPSDAEAALHLTLTLYAIHQQSRREAMHVPHGHSLGSASRQLAYAVAHEGDDTSEPPKALQVLLATSSLHHISHYARQLVRRLRAEGIPLDYSMLAVDLYRLQNPWYADGVRRKWGRDFVHWHRSDDAQDETGATE